MEKETLFDMTERWLELYAMADDPDTDPDVWLDTMESIEGEIEEKADNYCKLIKNMSADIEADRARIAAYKETIKAMEAHVNARQAMVDGARKKLAESMLTLGKNKLDTGTFKISARESASVKYGKDLRISDIPFEYVNISRLFEKPVKNNESFIDRDAIRAKLEDGEELGFATLETKSVLTIR